MMDVFGSEAQICLALDLTKISQKIMRGTFEEIFKSIEGKKIKGEATLVVSLA